MTENAIVGAKIGHYRVVSKIGSGGMGYVYLAEDTKLHRKAALKILPSEFAADDERMNRFIREARSASALNHPNIITIYEIGEADGTHFIATEYIEGETLHARMSGRPLSLETALEVAVQIASALDAAHQAGIIHRDIKPENIMLRPDGLVKILDFGVAKLTAVTGEAAAGATLPGMVIGTPNYMSPEQACGVEVDARSDIFSFGCVLYEMLCGRRAYTGDSPMAIVSSVIKDDPPALCGVDAEAAGIVERAMKKALDRRYQTITDVLADLRLLKYKLEHGEAGRLQDALDREASTAIFVQSDEHPAASAPNNLTEELLPLLGREDELRELRSLLAETDVRLVTITGVGGTGKTRLSEAVGRAVLTDFSDGVYWVDLSAIDDASLVLPAIAQTLGLREEKGTTLTDVLRAHLSERKMLLILDNFEQITTAGAQLGELLSASRNLKMLVTSRLRLQLRFEHEFILQPLDVPGGETVNVEELAQIPSVQLFVKRAQAAKSSFVMTEANAAAVAEICRKLEGLPLAIELAAARSKLLTPSAILTRLSSSLDLLTSGAKDLPERQQTMRAAIAWSYDLLDDNEKKLLDRLAVFSGGFSFEGAEAVANGAEDLNIDMLDGLSSLIDKSLLLQREIDDEGPWFRLLVVVKEFALEKLNASGEADEIDSTHAEFYTGLSEMFGTAFDGPDSAKWLARFELEHDNLLSALEWSLDHRPELALRIVGDVRSFWIRRGYLTEGSKWMRTAVEKAGVAADPHDLAKAYCALADSVWMQGDAVSAQRYYEESLSHARKIDDKYYTSTALRGLGYIRRANGDLDAAEDLIEESLAIARELKDDRLISLRLNSLGEMARLQRDHHTARTYYEEALDIARKLGAPYLIAVYANNLSAVTCILGDMQASRSYAIECLNENEALGDKMGIADAMNLFAALAIEAGDIKTGGSLFGASRSVSDSIGYVPEPLDREFRDHYVKKGREIAEEHFETALREGRSMGMKDAIALAKAN